MFGSYGYCRYDYENQKADFSQKFNGINDSDLPVHTVGRNPTIIAIALGALVSLALGGLGITGLLHSYQAIDLSPSWLVSVIEYLGDAPPYWGLWVISAVGIFGVCFVAYRIYKFYETENTIKKITEKIAEKTQKREALFKQLQPTLPNASFIGDPEQLKQTPQGCYAFVTARGSAKLFAANDGGTFHYHLSSDQDAHTDMGEKLLGVGFRFYDNSTGKIYPPLEA